MNAQKNNWRRDFRLATFAVFNHLGEQISEASININDAHDYFSVIKDRIKGAYVAQATKVEEYTLPLNVDLKAMKPEDLNNLWDIHVPVLQIMQIKLGLRPDNLPTLLPCKENKEVSKSLSDKAGNKHRGKYGGLVDHDNKYVFGEYDHTGTVRFAESSMFNKGTTTLKKPKRKDKDGAGITAREMPNTANVELQQVRLNQLIKKLLNDGLSYGQIKKHCKRKLKLRNSNTQICKTLVELSK